MDHGKRRHGVVQEVLAALFEGRLQPGERLRVEHLAKTYEVSVTPVREALVELAGLGLIDLQPNRGAVVRPFGPRQLREFSQLRRILESEATRNACGRIAPYELTALATGLSALVAAPRSPKWSAETRRMDTQLHELIAQRCGNERLAYELARYSVLFRMLRDTHHRRRTSRANYAQMEENSEHLAIVQALQAQNADAAAVAMSVHIQHAVQALESDMFAKSEIVADTSEVFLSKPVATLSTS